MGGFFIQLLGLLFFIRFFFNKIILLNEKWSATFSGSHNFLLIQIISQLNIIFKKIKKWCVKNIWLILFLVEVMM